MCKRDILVIWHWSDLCTSSFSLHGDVMGIIKTPFPNWIFRASLTIFRFLKHVFWMPQINNCFITLLSFFPSQHMNKCIHESEFTCRCKGFSWLLSLVSFASFSHFPPWYRGRTPTLICILQIRKLARLIDLRPFHTLFQRQVETRTLICWALFAEQFGRLEWLW